MLSSENETEIFALATGKPIVSFWAGSSKDVDIAVEAARKAYKTVWGLKVPGTERGKYLLKLADLMDQHADELSALEAMDVGKPYRAASGEITSAIDCFRYFGGWADKIHGKTIEVCGWSSFCLRELIL
jgi:aldehyde dehydrogenase (NAD+)